jgi:trehalose 6-phosphate synthase/phosphatase
MFRALLLFPAGAPQPTVMEAPLSVTLVAGNGPSNTYPPVELAIRPEGVFTTAVGHRGKRTLAIWHVTAPLEVVEHMLELVGSASAEEWADGEMLKSQL